MLHLHRNSCFAQRKLPYSTFDRIFLFCMPWRFQCCTNRAICFDADTVDWIELQPLDVEHIWNFPNPDVCTHTHYTHTRLQHYHTSTLTIFFYASHNVNSRCEPVFYLSPQFFPMPKLLVLLCQRATVGFVQRTAVPRNVLWMECQWREDIREGPKIQQTNIDVYAREGSRHIYYLACGDACVLISLKLSQPDSDGVNILCLFFVLTFNQRIPMLHQNAFSAGE